MKIGIDCRMWNETGIGRYIRNIVMELSDIQNSDEYVLFVLSKDLEEINLPTNKFRLVVTDIHWHTFREQLILPIYFYKEKLDLLFIPNLNVPVLYLKKFVVTIHDLTVTKIKTGRASTHHYIFYLMKRVGVKIALWYAIKMSKKIFTVSEFVKRDIMADYKVSANKIVLTPCAAANIFKPILDDTSSVLSKYQIKKPYIFYVGNAHPHKNIENLIIAFEKVLRKKPELTLVLGGSKKFFYERLEKEWSSKSVSNKINFTGFIDDVDLPAIYSEAEALVNPSLYEGFGIQILEAFSCGTKVVCSNTTSLPEIGGNIAYYFNPKDTDSIANSILVCLEDNSESRKTAGFQRVKEFSWVKSAQSVSNVFSELLARKKKL